MSITLDGSDVQEHAISEMADIRDFSLSPDLKWLAFKSNNRPYVMPFDVKPAPVTINTPDNGSARLLSDIGGYAFGWSKDSSTLFWTMGAEILSTTPADKSGTPHSLTINIQLPTDKPEGIVAFVGGKIVPIEGDVIKNGTVVVEGNRIVAVGPRRKVKIPKDATRIDIKGKVLMPVASSMRMAISNVASTPALCLSNTQRVLPPSPMASPRTSIRTQRTLLPTKAVR